jgi:hypothetical protein
MLRLWTIIFTSDIINSCLQMWRDTAIPSNRLQDNRPDKIILLSKERLDMAAYTFTYHMENGCALEKDCFWGNKHVWELLLKYRFEEHSACHKASCFKKGCECRFLFPLCQLPLCVCVFSSTGRRELPSDAVSTARQIHTPPPTPATSYPRQTPHQPLPGEMLADGCPLGNIYGTATANFVGTIP